MTFLTPNSEKFTHNQFVVVHKCVDALQEELGHTNQELSKCLNDCEHVNDEQTYHGFSGHGYKIY